MTSTVSPAIVSTLKMSSLFVGTEALKLSPPMTDISWVRHRHRHLVHFVNNFCCSGLSDDASLVQRRDGSDVLECLTLGVVDACGHVIAVSLSFPSIASGRELMSGSFISFTTALLIRSSATMLTLLCALSFFRVLQRLEST